MQGNMQKVLPLHLSSRNIKRRLADSGSAIIHDYLICAGLLQVEVSYEDRPTCIYEGT